MFTWTHRFYLLCDSIWNTQIHPCHVFFLTHNSIQHMCSFFNNHFILTICSQWMHSLPIPHGFLKYLVNFIMPLLLTTQIFSYHEFSLCIQLLYHVYNLNTQFLHTFGSTWAHDLSIPWFLFESLRLSMSCVPFLNLI